MNNRIRLALVLLSAALVPACDGSGSDGAPGPAGPPGVVINTLTATPPVFRPGNDSELSVSATDGSGGILSYAWSAPFGSLSSPSGNPVTWTAPDATGSFLVKVTVSNAAGSTAVGYVSLLVSVSPSGPIITNVNPADVWVGDSVRITGAGFGAFQGSSAVTVLGFAATVTSWTDTVIFATVPAGPVGAGDVLVTVAGVPSSPGYLSVSKCIPVSTAANHQRSPQIAPDGSGGAIIVWEDLRSGTNIYAQRVDAAGVVQWTADGVPVCTAAGMQEIPQITSDGSGGAIIVWRDDRSGTSFDIYAQRVDGTGAAQWTTDGVPVCTAADAQNLPQIVSDGSGGVIIAWQDFRSGTSYDIYAQRVNAAGVAQWTADGIPLCTAADWQDLPQLTADGSGGAIIAWRDRRSGTYDIYAQRVNAAGAVQWTADGVPLCTAAGAQDLPQIATDGSGGAIVAWQDPRSGTGDDIYAQRVNAAGAVQWTADGVLVCALASIKGNPQITPDGSGGAIIAWQDFRIDDFDIYAERLNSAGAAQWAATGVALCAAVGDQNLPQIASDGSGGAIVVWQDSRNGTLDIFAQRVDAAGAVQWTSNGVPVITAVNDQALPRVAAGTAGASITVWQDLRNGVTSDIYAQRLTAAGSP